MELPAWCTELIHRFEHRGFEAFAVGGCVRDMLLGNQPEDYDFAVSSPPEDTKRVLKGYPVYDTGLKHGTVTVIIGGQKAEITTYRRETGYSDFRRPDRVEFTGSLQEDLSRRDFTINAMAFHPDRGVVDCFGGRNDLNRRVIRCVGDPDKRFQEDALRLLRCLRFASALGFSIEAETDRALRRHRALLSKIAPERIQEEFSKLLLGPNADEILSEYGSVVSVFLPEFSLGDKRLSALPPKKELRLAGVLSSSSAFQGESALKRLKYDGKTVRLVSLLKACETAPAFDSRVKVRKLMARLGDDNALLVLQFRQETAGVKLLKEIQEKNLCRSLKQLAVSGEDLLALGYPEGKAVGETLRWLLQAVLEETLPNERESLLEQAGKRQNRDTKSIK